MSFLDVSHTQRHGHNNIYIRQQGRQSVAAFDIVLVVTDLDLVIKQCASWTGHTNSSMFIMAERYAEDEMLTGCWVSMDP